jgi:ABC-2 type transport system ATP-binding protein
MDPAIVASDVHKRYGDTRALAGVSLEVDSGELFALIGPNGAGKTTLVRCLTGIAAPGDGRVELLGGTPDSVDRSRLGLLPQSFDPPSRLTARELVAYYAGLYETAREPDDVLSTVGLSDTDTHYERLSGGQRRRVCVAAALVNDPEVLFLDEPTVGIDPAGRRSLHGVVENLVADGTTVLLTTHDMDQAASLADRVGLLADGELVATGTPSELVAVHGGQSTLHVETDAGPAPLREAAFDVREAEDGVVVEGVSPDRIGDVVRALDGAGVAFEALTWREPDLEDVYLSLTGEQVRGDGQATSLGGGGR